jgi:hypothetical protein
LFCYFSALHCEESGVYVSAMLIVLGFEGKGHLSSQRALAYLKTAFEIESGSTAPAGMYAVIYRSSSFVYVHLGILLTLVPLGVNLLITLTSSVNTRSFSFQFPLN